VNPPEQTLTEGTDYYVEGGRWVFTAAYHLRRGHCCESGCRHCPYGNSPDDRTNPVEEQTPLSTEEGS
jgi:hypothetical protein